MKINTLRVQGYRSLSEVTWNPGSLNVLIGPNASGKSNLLRVFELISASAEGKLASRIQSEGGLSALLWDGQAPLLEVCLEMLQHEARRDSLYKYQFQLAILGTAGGYQFRHELLTGDHYGQPPVVRTIVKRKFRHAEIFDDRRGTIIPVEEPFPEEETLLSVTAGPLGANKLSYQLQRELASWRIYQSLDTGFSSVIRQAAIARRETVVDRDGKNLIQVVHTLYSEHREFKHEINQAMTAAFGDEFEELVFAPAADQRIQMRVRWRSLRREQSAADLSDGTLRFLFLLAVLGNPDPPSLIAIDEPETGLHPSMLPIVAEYAVAASKKTQVIFTTHSPSFLDAFRDETPTTTVVEWKDGKTSLHLRTGDDLAYWLKEYSLGELYRTGELETVE